MAQYQDQAGFCKVVTLDDMKANDYVLTPGRYVGAADIEEDGIAFETKGRCEQVPDMRSCLSSGAMKQGSS